MGPKRLHSTISTAPPRRFRRGRPRFWPSPCRTPPNATPPSRRPACGDWPIRCRRGRRKLEVMSGVWGSRGIGHQGNRGIELGIPVLPCAVPPCCPPPAPPTFSPPPLAKTSPRVYRHPTFRDRGLQQAPASGRAGLLTVEQNPWLYRKERPRRRSAACAA